MNTTKPVVISLTLYYLLMALVLPAQPTAHLFYNLDMDDGLSRNYVSDITQDSYGFIWVATAYGLNRYDGYAFTSYLYDPKQPEGLSSNDISVLFEDSRGRFWAGTRNNGLNVYDRTQDRFRAIGPTTTWNIADIVELEDGNLWLATVSDGLIRFDARWLETDREEDINTLGSDRRLLNFGINCLMISQQQELWIGTTDRGLRIEHPKPESRLLVEQFNELLEADVGNPNFISDLYQSKDGRIWVGTTRALWICDPQAKDPGKRWRRLQAADHYSGPLPEKEIFQLNFTQEILQDKAGNLWIGTPAGIVRLSLPDESFSFFLPDKGSQYALAGPGQRTLYLDEAGSLWVGTDNGVSVLHAQALLFDQGVGRELIPPGLNASDIWQVLPVKDEYFLSSSKGLFVVTRRDRGVYYENLRDTNFTALYYDDKDRLYAGTVGGADLYEWNLPNRQLRSHEKTIISDNPQQLHGATIIDFAEDEREKIWIAAMGGLNRYDPVSDRFVWYDERAMPSETGIRLQTTTAVLVDRNEHLWIATSSGLAFLSSEELKKPFGEPLTFMGVTKFHGKEAYTKLFSNALQILFEASDGKIWIGSNTGLHSAVYRGDSIFIQRHYLRKEGVEPSIISMLEDDRGYLWIGTSNAGLFCYQPADGTSRQITAKDGTFSNTYRFNNCYKEKDGMLVFINEKKIISFYPDQIQPDTNSPGLYLTDLRLTGHRSTRQRGDYLFRPLNGDELVVEATEHTIQLTFAALDFLNPEKITYAYRLRGSEQEYISLGNQRELTFVNLAPRTYQLEIIAWNAAGVSAQNPLRLNLVIEPPFYRTTVAYALYGLLLAGLLYGLFLFQQKRRDARRFQQLNELKNRFITNITHEFKTPLTVMMGQNAQILQKGDQMRREDIRTKAQTIEKQAEQLRKLIWQLLDLRELDIGLKMIKPKTGDITAFLKQQVALHHSLAEARKVQVYFEADKASWDMAFDPELTAILFNNLLINAVKYTPSGGRVRISVSEVFKKRKAFMQWQVEDSGIGIDPEDLDHIFDIFYRSKRVEQQQIQGTGIGLALVAEILELLNGEIKVESQVGQGSIFTVWLPLIPKQMEMEQLLLNQVDLPVIKKERSSSKMASQDQPLILIIEDHPEMQQYLADCLNDHYRTEAAHNGNEGVTKAVNLQPDIIICDVMMPGKSGIEVCHHLKTQEATRHIPVIMLTAKADLLTEQEGIKSGADLYLGKPFDERSLILWIENQLQRRKQLQEIFSSSDWLAKTMAQQDELATADRQFLSEVLNIVQQQLHDPDLSVADLAAALQIGERTFRRHFRALTGRSAKSYIMELRMQTAQELLRNSDLNVEEIAGTIGYRSLAAFSRAFKKWMGISPNKFREREE